MESRLDSIFRTTFRTTESADTWMGIRREDPHDEGRRKKDDDDDKAEKPQWEDDAVVSIAALKQFLTTLIAPDSKFQKLADSVTAAPDHPPLSPRQQRAHNAASAYQTTASHMTPPPAPAETAKETVPDSPTLSQEENRIIHQLMNDLDALLQNGITALTIKKDGSFLESLSRAARTMLDSIT